MSKDEKKLSPKEAEAHIKSRINEYLDLFVESDAYSALDTITKMFITAGLATNKPAVINNIYERFFEKNLKHMPTANKQSLNEHVNDAVRANLGTIAIGYNITKNGGTEEEKGIYEFIAKQYGDFPKELNPVFKSIITAEKKFQDSAKCLQESKDINLYDYEERSNLMLYSFLQTLGFKKLPEGFGKTIEEYTEIQHNLPEHCRPQTAKTSFQSK